MKILEYLSDRITGKAPKGAKRSKHWSKLRKEIIKENPQCSVCGGTQRLQAHHIIPFHLAPELELDRKNIVVLCARKKVLNCHLIFGHLGDFRKVNPSAGADIANWSYKLTRKL